MFENYRNRTFAVDGATIHAKVGGDGPPLLLMHGHPQSHVMWHRVADPLAQRYTVVAMDLRGYGDSSRPPPQPDHASYSKRTMAQDAVSVMRELGFERFAIGAHDRGARVAHRLCLDHPDTVTRMMLLDIAPTLAMYEHTTEAFARGYWHWFLLIQPAPLPERLIELDPVGYLHTAMGRGRAGLEAFDSAALCEYERCIQIAGSAKSICEDYRASATIDLEHDRADRDAGRRVTVPLHVLWGAHGVVAQCFDVLELWSHYAIDVTGRTLACGHYIAEERPEELLDAMLNFFQ